MTDLQTGITVNANGTVTGTVKKLASYPPYDITLGDHFIALHAEADNGMTLKCLVTPTQGMGLVTLDLDGIVVAQITENTKGITFYAYDGDDLKSEIYYDLTKLTFEA